MKNLRKNAINILGKEGNIWLSHLPNTIEILADHWNLSSIHPVDNMTYHYVAKAMQGGSRPVILKIGFDKISIVNEKRALAYFDGNASIQIIDYNQNYNSLLLQQAIPGVISLKSFYPHKDRFVIDSYVTTVKKLLAKPLISRGYHFPHISDWLIAIDTVAPSQLPEYLLKKAMHLKNTLLASLNIEYLLHGDLHHDNIIKDGKF